MIRIKFLKDGKNNSFFISFLSFYIIISFLLSLFSIFSQYYISVIRKVFIQKSETFIFSNIKFFLYFTIQTNILILIIYSILIFNLIKNLNFLNFYKNKFNKNNIDNNKIDNNNSSESYKHNHNSANKLINKIPFSIYSSTLVYIIIVAVVYNMFLRKLWQTKGFQKIVDNFLHVFNPLIYFFFWFLFVEKIKIKKIKDFLKFIIKWIIYPFTYLIIILIIGYFFKNFPYPFLNFYKLGFFNVLFNIICLIIFFLFLSCLVLVFSNFINSIKNKIGKLIIEKDN